ncbi:hypothetical protein ACHAXT_003787 [Thalassiosira profunda]
MHRRRFFIVTLSTAAQLVIFAYSSTHSSNVAMTNSSVGSPLLFKVNDVAVVINGTRFLTTQSGCRMARWLYTQEWGAKRSRNECADLSPPERVLRHPAQLQAGDTVFVPHTALDQFAMEMLDEISVGVVVISGRTHGCNSAKNETIKRLLDNVHLKHWFCQNLERYGGENCRHPKLSPFPYGLKEIGHKGPRIFSAYKRIFYESLSWKGPQTEKARFIFAGPLGNTNVGRAGIPKTGNLPPGEYFEKMARSSYILSPNGDRPETYRHYEAIGLGVAPITELDPFLYRHLSNSGAVFNNSDWSISSLESKLDPEPTVTRNLIWEDYWVEWIESVVETSLNWNDIYNRRAKMASLVQ